MLLVCVLTPYTCFAPSIHIMVLLLLLLLFCSLCFEQTQQHQSFLHSSLIHLFRPTQRTLPPRESSPLSRASPFLSQFPLVACLLFFLLLPPPPLFRARSNHAHFSLPSISPSHFFFFVCVACAVWPRCLRSCLTGRLQRARPPSMHGSTITAVTLATLSTTRFGAHQRQKGTGRQPGGRRVQMHTHTLTLRCGCDCGVAGACAVVQAGRPPQVRVPLPGPG